MASNLPVKGRKSVVIGANPSGLALCKFLLKKGAQVSLVDFSHAETITPLIQNKIDLSKINTFFGNIDVSVFENADFIAVSQGIPLDLKELESARTKGVQVLSELELFALFVDEPIIAIAGTKGKSTTAHILSKFLEAQQKTVFTNVQQPLANYLLQNKTSDYVVVTTNTFQLEGVQNFKPSMILFLNVFEDHADRYPNPETYISVIREVLKNADEKTLIISNAQDNIVTNFVSQTPSQLQFFATVPLNSGIPGAYVHQGNIICRPYGQTDEHYDLSLCRLRGLHNKENLAAAIQAARLLGVDKEQIQKTIPELRTLPHRLEFVRRLNSVAFYNDAAATNVQAAIRSLNSFKEPLIVISGGRDKNADYSPLTSHIRQRVKNLILVGEAKEKMNRALGDYTETFLVGTLEEAVLMAYQKSRSGDVILFTPIADYRDAFSSTEERGDYFKKLATQISQPRKPNVI